MAEWPNKTVHLSRHHHGRPGSQECDSLSTHSGTNIDLMALIHYTRSAFRVLTQPSDGPTLYELCDPLLLASTPADESHLQRFYRVALAHPALRLILRRAGLPHLRDPSWCNAVRQSILAARDEPYPDWQRIGSPVADLLDKLPQHAPRPARRASPIKAIPLPRIEHLIQACAAHLMTSYKTNDFIPAYAAFNLTGDPDMRGRELLIALDGLHARTYKHATLMFNLARAFILSNPDAAALISPSWTGVAEPMWSPVQIRHRSAYYDAFYAEALMDYLDSGLSPIQNQTPVRHAIGKMIHFCLETSRERVHAPVSGRPFDVITALAPPPHSQLSQFFWQLKHDLGFGLYVPDCDTTACSFSAATKFNAPHPLLDQPLPDFYAEYQVAHENRRNPPTVTINDHLDLSGGIVTWIENLAGDRPCGNDLDPTLNLDILEVSFLNYERWRIGQNPHRQRTLREIIRFQGRLVDTGAFADPRSHIYYLPELYCAYVGRCYEAFMSLPSETRTALDQDRAFERIRHRVIAYVRDELLARDVNVFDAALGLLALAKLNADPAAFAPALTCIEASFGEGRRPLSFLPTPLTSSPFKAYEWNKMKTPTRILVGGPEVTSAFVLSALVHARKRMRR